MTARQRATGQAPAAPLVDLRGIGVRYPGAAAAALADVYLTVGHGELVTFAGPAGSGKSTLLGVIGLLLRPTSGSYLLSGLDTATLGDRDRAALRCRQIGCVLQRPHLLPARSALENVMLPVLYSGLARQRRRNAALEALDRVGLAGAAHVAAGRLAAGEQQRTAIARAIVTGPSLLLCDDPTASLDNAAAAQVIGLLVGLRRDGRTVLVATGDQLAEAHSSRTIAVGAMNEGAGR
jgi:putative ABC transport system ATP-binding protein